MVFMIVFSVMLIITFFIGKTFLAQFYDEEEVDRRIEMDLFNLSQKLDSLEQENISKDRFINAFKTMLDGGETLDSLPSSQADDPLPIVSSPEVEEARFFQPTLPYSRERGLSDIFFYPPISGYEISESFNYKEGHYGVDIVANPGELVKSIADGTVIVAEWTEDSGYMVSIQHGNNLISVYKHNSVLRKKVGNFVKAGDVIAIIGDSGELTSGSHLHFELWQSGVPLNPEYFVKF
jgi:murein DD-endopeptidase MepM/ murein hydrolase activator NlpD